MLVHDLKCSCCRLENEDYYEELSDNEAELCQQEEVVGVVVPQPVNIPLEVQVVPAEYPKSPSPSPATPSPQVPSPLEGSPLGDTTSFMSFYTHDDIVDLEQWTKGARGARTNPTTRIEEPDVSPNLKTFLRYNLRAQWAIRLVRELGRF